MTEKARGYYCSAKCDWRRNKHVLQCEGYKFVKFLEKGTVLFQDKVTGDFEVWGANKFHASFGLKWRGTDWEFIRMYTGYVPVIRKVK